MANPALWTCPRDVDVKPDPSRMGSAADESPSLPQKHCSLNHLSQALDRLSVLVLGVLELLVLVALLILLILPDSGSPRQRFFGEEHRPGAGAGGTSARAGLLASVEAQRHLVQSEGTSARAVLLVSVETQRHLVHPCACHLTDPPVWTHPDRVKI